MAAKAKNLTLTEGHSYIMDIWPEEQPPIIRKPIISVTSPNGCAQIESTAHGVKDGARVAVTNLKGTMSQINADMDALKNYKNTSEYHPATVLSADLIELNDTNVADLVHTPNTGFIQYNTPTDLTGHVQRCRVRDKQGGSLVVCSVPGTTGSVKPTRAGQDGSVTWVKPSASELTALRISQGASYTERVWVGSTAYSADDVVDLSVIASSDVADAPYDVLEIDTDVSSSRVRLTFPPVATTLLSGKTAYYDVEDVSADTTPVVSALIAGSVTVEKE